MTNPSWEQGRTYFTGNLEAAMRYFGSYVDTKRRIREIVRTIDHDSIWVPASKSYIAFGRNGRAVAWVHKTFATPAPGEHVFFPQFQDRDRGRATPAPRIGEACPECYQIMPLTGICDECA